MSVNTSTFKSSLTSKSSPNGNTSVNATKESTGFFSAVRAKLRPKAKEVPVTNNNNNNGNNMANNVVKQIPNMHAAVHPVYNNGSAFAPLSLPPLPSASYHQHNGPTHGHHGHGIAHTYGNSTVISTTGAHYRQHHVNGSLSLSGDSAADAEDSKEQRPYGGTGGGSREYRGGSSSLYAEHVTRSQQHGDKGTGVVTRPTSPGNFDEVDGFHTSRSGGSGSTDDDADSEWSHSGSNSHAARRARELKEDRERWAQFEAAGRTFDDNEPPLITSINTGGVASSITTSLVSARSVSVNPSRSYSGSSSGSEASRRRKHNHTTGDDVPSAAARNGKKSRKGPGNRSPGGADYVAKQLASLVIQPLTTTNSSTPDAVTATKTSGATTATTDSSSSTTATTFAAHHPFGFVPSTSPTSTTSAFVTPAVAIAQLNAPTSLPSSSLFITSASSSSSSSSTIATSTAAPCASAFPSLTVLPAPSPSATSSSSTKPAVVPPMTEQSAIRNSDAWQMECTIAVTPMVGVTPISVASPIAAKPRRVRQLGSLPSGISSGVESSITSVFTSMAPPSAHDTAAAIIRRQKHQNANAVNGSGIMLDPLDRPSSPSLNSHQVDGAHGRSRSPSSTRHTANGGLMSPSTSVIHSPDSRLRRTHQSSMISSFDSPTIHVNRSLNQHGSCSSVLTSPSSRALPVEQLTARSIDSSDCLESPELGAINPHRHAHTLGPSGRTWSQATAAAVAAEEAKIGDAAIAPAPSSSMPSLDLRKCRRPSVVSSARSEISDNGLSSPISKGGMSISGTSALSERDNTTTDGDDTNDNNDNSSRASRPSSSSSCRPMMRSRSPSSVSSTTSGNDSIITSNQGRAHRAGSKRNSGGVSGLIAAAAALPPLKFAPKRPGTAKSAAPGGPKKAPFNSPRPNGQAGPFNSPRPSPHTTGGNGGIDSTPSPISTGRDSNNGAVISSPVSQPCHSRGIRSFFR